MTKQPILTFLGVMALSAWTGNADAQGENQRMAHAAMYLQPVTGTTTIPFDWNDAGKEFRIRWGLDTAWDDVSNVRRGTNFYRQGKHGDGTYLLPAKRPGGCRR